jgi:hypothetical protein
MEHWKYSVSEDVLAYDGPLLYRGKIKERKFYPPGDKFLSKTDDPGAWYIVHFPGFGSQSNIQTPEGKILPNTEENRALQQKLSAEIRQRKKTPRTNSNQDSDSDSKKRVKPREEPPDNWRLKELDLSFPPSLQTVLINDMGRARRGVVAKVPNRTSVSTILLRFIEVKERIALNDAENKGKSARVMAQMTLENLERREFCRAFLVYFDNLVAEVLLYDAEKPAFKQLRLQKIRPSDAYGFEHLLRMCGTTTESCVNLFSANARFDTCYTLVRGWRGIDATHFTKSH